MLSIVSVLQEVIIRLGVIFLLMKRKNFGESITVNKKDKENLRTAKIHFVQQELRQSNVMVLPTLQNLEKVIEAIK